MMIRLLAVLLLASPAFAEPVPDRKRLKPGLVATFHDGTTAKRRLEPAITLRLAANESMHPALARTTRAEWTGFVQIVTAGDYTFGSTASGGTAKVTLTPTPGDVVLDALAGKPLTLEAGYYRIDASFDMHLDGVRQFELQWSGPGFRREPIPWFFFSHLPTGAVFALDYIADTGRFLVEEHGCINCHTTEAKLAPRMGPNLTEIGKRVFPGWLDAWLADPAKLRPHTTMPKMFDETPKGQAERYAVTQYLMGLVKEPLADVKPPMLDRNYARSLGTGQALFVSTGCAACHGQRIAGTMKATDDDDDTKKPSVNPQDTFHASGSSNGAQDIYSLKGIGTKTTADALARYLRNPLHTNAQGRMPDMNLTSDEARDIARHLMRQTDDTVADKLTVPKPPWTVEQLRDEVKTTKPGATWRDLGEALVVSKGCVNCHVIEVKGTAIPKNATFARLDALAFNSTVGCLSKAPHQVNHAFDDGQRSAVQEFLKSGAGRGGSPAYEARANLKRFNCLNCHARDGEGGIGTELAEMVKKADSAGNEDDVAPPRLTGIAHKATPGWLAKVLLKGERARPWMPLRMPQYGEANVGAMVAGLAACEGVPSDVSATKPKASPDLIAAGRKLIGKEGLGCVACHDISGLAGGGTRGPDLALTDSRVNKEWYGRWMHNPQRLAPGTKMPSNFTDGKSVNTLLNSDADAQIDALWAYLSLGPGLPLPNGMVPPGKSMPLIPTTRPEVLRTFMPGDAGTRPIAVGFPNNGGAYVFDSHAARITYAWEGNFLDVSPVWGQRGGNAAKLLGTKYLVPPPGNPWLVNDGEMPDFAKRKDDYGYGAPVPFQMLFKGPMRVQLLGYALDSGGVPTFQYRVEDDTGKYAVAVSDTPRPVKSAVASGLARQFAVERPAGKTVWFQVATGAAKPRMVNQQVIVPLADGKALVVMAKDLPNDVTFEMDAFTVLLKFPATTVATTSKFELTTWALPRDDEALIATVK